MNTIKRRKRLLFLLLGLSAVLYFTLDYIGPRTIKLKPDEAFGYVCYTARDLIVQEYDTHGNLWATRGMIVYQQAKGDSKFTKVGRVPHKLSILWLRHFSIVRRLTIRPECVELVTSNEGDLCALSGGYMWYSPSGSRKFYETMEVKHYGFGNQGIRNVGLTDVDDNTIYLGEYFQNFDKGEVNIFSTSYSKNPWNIAYKFSPGETRHLHAIQEDPYSDKVWFCSGDSNTESMVGWSDDNFQSIHVVGTGSQVWRVCQLVFTEDAVYWGTDTSGEDEAGIYRLDRASEDLVKLHSIKAAMFYGTRLSNGMIVMSSNRQGLENEIDDRTRLYLIDENDQVTTIECGTWNHKKPGFWFKYAKLRFQRTQNNHALAITCLNQKEFRDGDLIIYSEKALSNKD